MSLPTLSKDTSNQGRPGIEENGEEIEIEENDCENGEGIQIVEENDYENREEIQIIEDNDCENREEIQVVEDNDCENGEEIQNGEENDREESFRVKKRKLLMDDEDMRKYYENISNCCEVCGQKFNNRIALNSHRRYSHLFKYQCMLCHRKFIDNTKLEAHKMTHMTRLKNNCHLCGKTYMTIRSLKKHYFNIHYSFAEDVQSNPFPIMFINVFDV